VVADLGPDARCVEHAQRSDDALERLMGQTLAWLSLQLGTVAAAFTPVDRRLRAFTTGPIVTKLDTPLLRLRARHARHAYLDAVHGADPFSPRRWHATSATVVSIPEVGGRDAFDTSRYAAFLAGLGLGPQASVFLRRDGRIAAAIVLLRAAGAADFAPEDLAQLRRTQPFLQEAFVLGSARSPAHAGVEAPDAWGLTAREREVARLISAGATNAEIAQALCVGLPTVKTHVSHLLHKLGARSRTELVARLAARTVSSRGAA
jgi:DNA-binding CsgD family transcriptional regulator